MLIPKRRITKNYFELACKKYNPLIRKLSYKFGKSVDNVDDMMNRAMLELLKCLICYDSQYGSFMTFLYTRLAGVLRHMRDSELRSNPLLNMRTRIDSPGILISHPEDMDTSLFIEECLQHLTTEEREVISGLFYKGKTMRELSKERGTVHSAIHRIKERAIEKMHRICSTEYKS
jgi:RNA polymerase sigma factor (sigma-70 family)